MSADTEAQRPGVPLGLFAPQTLQPILCLAQPTDANQPQVRIGRLAQQIRHRAPQADKSSAGRPKEALAGPELVAEGFLAPWPQLLLRNASP